MSPKPTIDPSLQPLVEDVSRKASAMSSAFEAERDAEATLLGAVLELVEPACRALASALPDMTARGVVLARRDNRLTGSTQLILTEDGMFLLRCTATDGVSARWVFPSMRDVVEQFDLDDILTALGVKLRQYADGAAASTATKALRRAERLEAIALLVKS